MKRTIVVGLCSCLILLAAACAINPVTGKKELSLISEQGEIELGKETDAEIGQEYGFYQDKELSAYVAAVGEVMVPSTHRPQLEYHFAVLDTPVVNAFAAPGGYIYVTRGILALMNSESELADVLGHEMGHVNARHSVRRVSQMLLLQVGLAVGSALSDTFAKIAGVAGLGAQVLFLKFSRDDEREADALGVQYARAGQFNSGEMISFFSSLERYGDLSGGHSLPGFLSTHPLTSERIQNVKAMLGELDIGRPKRREAYIRRIDGIIYGDDPRQGFVEKNVFYHPQMRFAFAVPQGWEVQNTPVQVALATKQGDGALILRVEKTDEDLAAFAKKKTDAIEGRQFVTEQRGTINGLASLHQIYNIVKEGQDTLRLRLTFLKKGEQIFYFSALSRAIDFNRFDATFQSAVSSFGELKDPAYLGRQPQRLKIVQADGQRRLRDYFSQTKASEERWPLYAIMNGLKDGDSVPEKNQLIKIIQ